MNVIGIDSKSPIDVINEVAGDVSKVRTIVIFTMDLDGTCDMYASHIPVCDLATMSKLLDNHINNKITAMSMGE